jgi:hypothetical protein
LRNVETPISNRQCIADDGEVVGLRGRLAGWPARRVASHSLPQEDSWYECQLEAGSTPGQNVTGRIRQTEKSTELSDLLVSGTVNIKSVLQN